MTGGFCFSFFSLKVQFSLHLLWGIKVEPTDRWRGAEPCETSGSAAAWTFTQLSKAVLDGQPPSETFGLNRDDELTVYVLFGCFFFCAKIVRFFRNSMGWLASVSWGGELLWSGKALLLKGCKNSQGPTSLKLPADLSRWAKLTDGPICRLAHAKMARLHLGTYPFAQCHHWTWITWSCLPSIPGIAQKINIDIQIGLED